MTVEAPAPLDGDQRSIATTLLGLTAAILLWGTAFALSVTLISDLTRAEHACDRTIPWFEGIVVEDAALSSTPPLIRCSLVDTDEVQYGDQYRDSLWGWPEVTVLMLLYGASIWVAFHRQRRWGVPSIVGLLLLTGTASVTWSIFVGPILWLMGIGAAFLMALGIITVRRTRESAETT